MLFNIAVYNAHLADYENCDSHGRKAIANGACVQQTVNAHDARKNVCTGQEVKQLPCQSTDHCLGRLADRLEEDTRGDEEADEEDNTEEDVEALEGKLVVQFVLLSENVYYVLCAELEASPADDAYDKADDYRSQVRCLNAVKVFRAVVVADDRLTSDAETDHNADDDGVDLHYYAESGERDVRTINALYAVFYG